MKRIEFNKLIKNKNENELHRILNRYANNLIYLNNSQVNKIIKLKEEIRKGKREINV